MDPIYSSALVLYLFSSFLGVSNMILWGLYGDLLVENFDVKKVFRSLVFGLVAGCFFYLLNDSLPLLLVALSAIAIERLLTEMYKALWRLEDQSKYKIPSDLGIRCNVLTRRIVFLFLVLVLFFVLWNVAVTVSGIVAGLLVGLCVAIGGAMKDAPYEGFQPIKFLRSPVIALLSGLLLVFLFPNTPGLFFLLGVGGLERIVSEFYKKIVRGRIPGKFRESLKENASWRKNRKYLLVLYVTDIVALFDLLFI
ncbi:MAG: hypothetical protein AAB460_00515 [Patescibacteria group bacterium]